MGMIEAIPNEDPPSNVHYMPHHTVILQGKSMMKVSVVYNASAKMANSPLNDCHFKGMKFNQLIFDILVQFHSYQTALTADLEKLF